MSGSAKADWELFPESRHHLYESYSFFVEQQNALLWMGSSKYWATVAGNLPVFGNDSSDYHPQLVLSISGNDSMWVDGSGGVYTLSLDTRIGLAYEFEIPQIETRFSLGYQHESGHVVDGNLNSSLPPLNLGYDTFRFRAVHDFGKTVRLGITIIPVDVSIPSNLPNSAEEFVEYFPLGSKEKTGISPFVSASLQHPLGFDSKSSFNAEIGIAKGNHFEKTHTGDVRFVIGYYNGVNPVSKFAAFTDNSTSEFGYTGVMFSF